MADLSVTLSWHRGWPEVCRILQPPCPMPIYEVVDGQVNLVYLIANQSRRRQLPKAAWDYIDELKLHVFEMRHLPEEVRKLFQSDMRIVVDFLAEGNSYRSDRKIKHKSALVKMLKVLSGEKVTDGDVEKWMEECRMKEEDEVTVCELFYQYERKGKAEGISQGIVKGKVEDSLELLEDHGEIHGELREKIFGEKDLAVLKRWLKLAVKVNSVEEFESAM